MATKKASTKKAAKAKEPELSLPERLFALFPEVVEATQDLSNPGVATAYLQVESGLRLLSQEVKALERAERDEAEHGAAVEAGVETPHPQVEPGVTTTASAQL